MDWRFYAALGVLVGGGVGLPLLANRLREYRLSRAGLSNLSQMTDEDMLVHMGRLFGALGYRVYRPTWEGAGVELILIDGLGQKRGVLIRAWRQLVDEPVVRQAVESAQRLDSAAPMVVSVEGYTFKARNAAKETGAILWSLQDLTEAIGRVRQTAVAYPEMPVIRVAAGQAELAVPAMEPVAAGLTAASGARSRRRPARLRPGEYWGGEGVVPKCPKCSQNMVTKEGTKGSYWLCSAFPRCLGSRPKV